MELQTPYLASYREALMKKKSFGPKTLKFLIVCNHSSQGPAFQSLASVLTSYCRSIESSFGVLIYFSSCVIFELRFKSN